MQSGRIWISMTLLFALCAAARAQTTSQEAISAKMGGGGKDLPACVGVQPGISNGWEDNRHPCLRESAGFLAGTGSRHDEGFGLTQDGPSRHNFFTPTSGRGIQEILPELARGLTAAGAEGGAKGRAEGDEATSNSAGKIEGSLEGTVKNESGAGVSGVVVTVSAPAGNSQTAVTGTTGTFRVPLTATGSSRQSNMSFRGKVTEVSGAAVLGVDVTVKTPGGNSITAVTDANGKFQIGGLKWDNKLNTFTKPSSKGWPGDTNSQIKFWSLQGLMFATAVAAAETTHNCFQTASCTAIPTQFRSRAAMYSVGIPVVAGVAILSYEMKKHDNRWWYLPPTFALAAEGLLTFHSASASK